MTIFGIEISEIGDYEFTVFDGKDSFRLLWQGLDDLGEDVRKGEGLKVRETSLETDIFELRIEDVVFVDPI